MKHRLAALILFLVGCATGGVASRIGVTDKTANAAQGTWRYSCFRTDHTIGVGDKEISDYLNRAGADGWELASDVALGPAVSRTC